MERAGKSALDVYVCYRTTKDGKISRISEAVQLCGFATSTTLPMKS